MIITFSVNKSQQELLEHKVKGEESLNLCAKRLILKMLEEGDIEEQQNLQKQLGETQEKLFSLVLRIDELEFDFEALKKSLDSKSRRVAK